ncbi:MAG TPA: class I SAM-dependent methyltransferase, partial [Patescibacteria group bacterium]|nr:class I SAM-dependent methyltransferase [Patescibacteria group bacterium]
GAGVVASAEAAGLKVFDQFSLPRSAWWDEYYTPLTRRIAALRDDAATDPALAALIAATQAEIAGFERYGDCFGYAFYLMRLA